MHKAIFISVLILVVDQLSKFLAERAGIVTWNQGISFGFLAAMSPLVMYGLIALFLVGICWHWKSLWQEQPLAAGLFFGGAVSNFLDRIVYSGVRDWLPVPFFHIHNNLADWAIFIGLAYTGIVELQRARKKNSL